MEFVRTSMDTWAWERDGEIVGGTTHHNPKPAMAAGLELLEGSLRDGDVDVEEVEAAVEAARELVANVEETGEAHRAAAKLARDFLRDLDEPG
jgi:hypothetical protein